MGATTLFIAVVIVLSVLAIAIISQWMLRRAPHPPPYLNNEAGWTQNAPAGSLHALRPDTRQLAYTLSIHRYRNEAVAYVVLFHDYLPPMPEAANPHRHFEEALRYAWRMEVSVREWRDYAVVLQEAVQQFEAGLAVLQQSGWWVDSRPADSPDLRYYRLAR